MAEDAWNTREPERVALACTRASTWRNRSEFLSGHRIAVRFAYEWHDDSGHWFRSYGNENREFDQHGFMQRRIASINDLLIQVSKRKYHRSLGRRPDDHPGLSDLGL